MHPTCKGTSRKDCNHLHGGRRCTVQAAPSSWLPDHCPPLSVLNSHRHLRENGEMAGGIEYSNFDRVGTVSILTRIQQEAVTDSGGRVREVLAYIRSVLTIWHCQPKLHPRRRPRWRRPYHPIPNR